MPYCIDCGVKVSDNHKNCPLCRREIEFPSEPSKKYPNYPTSPGKIKFFKVKNSKRKNTLVTFLGFILLLISSITLGINYISAGKIGWSLISTSTFAFIFLVIYLISILSSSPYILYSGINILLGFYLFLLDGLTSQFNWFLEYALESFIYLQFSSLGCLIIFKAVKSYLYRAAVIIIMSSIYLNLIDINIFNKISWSIISSSVLLPSTIFLIILKLNLPKPSDLK